MSTLTGTTAYPVRIAALTAATPMLAGAAAAATTAKLAAGNCGSSPAHRCPPRPGGLEPNTASWPPPMTPANHASRQQDKLGTAARAQPDSAPARSGQARAQLAALSSSR